MNQTERTKQSIARFEEKRKNAPKFNASVFFNSPVIRTDEEIQREVILVIKNIQQGKSVEEIASLLKMDEETVKDIKNQYNSIETL